jgi:hypothetical protein
MSYESPDSGRWIDLSELEYGRLRTLNEQLQQADDWINRRSQEMVMAYCLATARARHDDNGRLDEDVDLIATVLFLPQEGHPDFRPHTDDILARIDIPILRAACADNGFSYIESPSKSDYLPSHGEWNRIFLDLYDRILKRDKEKLLSIGALCVDVALIQQQIRSW